MRRHAVDSANLAHLEFARLKELSLAVRHGNPLELHALFEDGDFPRVRAAAIGRVPCVAQFLRVFQPVRMRQHARRGRAVAEYLAPVFLRRQRQSERRLHQCDRAVAHNAVKAHARYV